MNEVGYLRLKVHALEALNKRLVARLEAVSRRSKAQRKQLRRNEKGFARKNRTLYGRVPKDLPDYGAGV